MIKFSGSVRGDTQNKVRNRLIEELSLAIIAVALSMNLKSSGYHDQVDQIFAEIKAACAVQKQIKNNG
ncbi:MAG: hypothetical protein LW599_03815 [Rickettsiaceae bacterium]|jgi:hypothetical protein|nr:hypothetical protein [Rickettsiaceae bacterium]